MTKILEERKQERTSKAQIIWLGLLCQKLLKKIGGHVKRFGLIYGFLGGMVSTLLILAAVIWYGVLAYPLPWKVIDPTDPRFDPMKFEFTDYYGMSDFQDRYSCMFPIGTEKSYVDKILVEVGGAHIQKWEVKNQERYHSNEYRYTHEILRDRIFRLFYHMHDTESQPSVHFTIKFDKTNRIEDAYFLNNPCMMKGKNNDK